MASVLFTQFLACSVGIGLLSTLIMITAPSWSRFFAAKWSMRLWGVLAACLCFPLTPRIPAVALFFSRYAWIMVLWLVIAVSILVFLFLQQHRFRKAALRWGKEPANGTFAVKAARLAEELNMKCPSVYITAEVSCPTILGIGDSLLLLPHESYSDTEFDIILRHEFYHYLHGHISYKIFLAVVCALHWFNPAVWLMRQRAELDLETACDDALLSAASDKTRKQYSDSILSVMQAPARCKSPFSTHSYGTPEETGHRLVRLLAPPPKTSGSILLGAAVVLSLLSGNAIAFATTSLEVPSAPAIATPPSTSSQAPAASVEASSDSAVSSDTLSTDESTPAVESSSEESSNAAVSNVESSDAANSETESSSEESSDATAPETESSLPETEPTSPFPTESLRAVQFALPDLINFIKQPAQTVLAASQSLENIALPGEKTESMPSDEIFLLLANIVIDAYNSGNADTSMSDPEAPRLMPAPSSIESIPRISSPDDFIAIPRTSNGYSIVVPIPDSDRQMQIWADDNGPGNAYRFDIVAVDFAAR